MATDKPVSQQKHQTLISRQNWAGSEDDEEQNTDQQRLRQPTKDEALISR